MREDDPIPAKYVNSPEGELFRGPSSTASTARARNHEGRSRARRRGLYHRRPGAAPGGARRHGRVDGHGAHGAPGEGAPAPDRTSLSLLRRRRGRRVGDDPRHGLAVRSGFGAHRPAAGGIRRMRRRLRGLAASVGYLRHRVQLELANPSSQEAFERIQRMIDDAPPGPERDEAARLASDGLQVPLRIAGGSASVVPARRGSSSSVRVTDSSGTSCHLRRPARSWPNGTCRASTTGTSTTRSTGASAHTSSARAKPTRRSWDCGQSSTRPSPTKAWTRMSPASSCFASRSGRRRARRAVRRGRSPAVELQECSRGSATLQKVETELR